MKIPTHSKLDEPKTLIQTLQELSITHSKLYHVKKPNYIDFYRGFMKAINRELNGIIDDYENAWNWFWEFMISIMSPDKIEDDGDDISEASQAQCQIEKTDNFVDIFDYYDNHLILIQIALKHMDAPHSILQIIALYSLNLTVFHRNKYSHSVQVTSCPITGNADCCATLISNNQHCGNIMSPFWITNKENNNRYKHRIEVIVESVDKINCFVGGFDACIGFTSKILQKNNNAFGDLKSEFAVRCRDKRMINGGMVISKYSLQSKSTEFENNTMLWRRLNEFMQINDKLAFIVDMNDKKCVIDIELNDTKQKNELKFVLNGVDRIAFCASLWTKGIKLRIVSWILQDKKL